MELFVEITLVLGITALVSFGLYLLRQPLIIAYILSGVIVGPLGLNILTAAETLDVFSKLGITTLLFIIGLNLNPKIIKEVGKVSLITGVGQIAFTSLIGFALTLLLGFSWTAALIIAIGLTFSSTIIILKLLNDKGDTDKLYGKISIGFLLVQDLVACILLLIISVLAQSGQLTFVDTVLILSLRIVALAMAVGAFSWYLLPKLLQVVAGSQELLFLFSITWGLLLSSLFFAMGLSIEIGALIAGVTLSATPFAREMASRLRPLRDFFVITFFILLGSHLTLDTLSTVLWPSILLSIFVLVGNPLIVFYLMNLLGYKSNTSFKAGLTVAQISEFSMILVALAYESGFVDTRTVSLITLVGVITITISSYMITHSNRLYQWLAPMLKTMSLRKKSSSPTLPETASFDAILFGFGRVGVKYLTTFAKLELKPLVVDYNPDVVAKFDNGQTEAVYGDAGDLEFLNELPLAKVKLVISSLKDYEVDRLIIEEVRKLNPGATVIVKTDSTSRAKALYERGATYVIMPYYIGATYAASLIKRNGTDEGAYHKDRQEHLHFLKNR